LTSCYAAVFEEAAFPSSDPQSDQHMDLILGRDLLAPEVLHRVIRLFAINACFFCYETILECHFCPMSLYIKLFAEGIFMDPEAKN